MTWLIRGIAAASLGATLLYGSVLLKDPVYSLRWSPVQGFQRVPLERAPEQAARWEVSVRQVDRLHPWPEKSDPLQAAIADKNNDAPFDFPVLVPVQVVESELAIAATRFRYEQLDQGYYVIFQTAHMEILILATSSVHHRAGAAVDDQPHDYIEAFQDPGPRPAGGRITFGHFGVDYSVTFDCKVSDPGLTRNCISKTVAERFVASLTQGTPAPISLPDFEGS